MKGIFKKIIDQEIPSYKIFEDDSVYSFLDINPASKGHALVIPKKEIDLLWDLESQDYLHLMSKCKMIAEAIKKSTNCVRVGMAVVGLEVPHAHVHLIPLNSMADFNFANKLKFTEDEFLEIQKSIISHL